MSRADIQERARLLDEIGRLQSELDAANDRFHAMNSPTGREIELQAVLDGVLHVSKPVEIDGKQWIAIPRAAWMAAAEARHQC